MLGAWEPGGEAPASATTMGKADVDLGTVVNSPIRVQPVVESTRRPGVASPGKGTFAGHMDVSSMMFTV